MAKKKTNKAVKDSSVQYKSENGLHYFKYNDSELILPESEYWLFIKTIALTVVMNGFELQDKFHEITVKKSCPADSTKPEIKNDEGDVYKVV